MTLQESLRFYENQAAALNVVEQMEQAMSRVVEQMEKLLNASQKTTTAASQMKSPFDNIAKNIGAQAQQGFSKLQPMLDPKQLLAGPNFLLPLAIGVGWELFGDDIMTILTPAMGVLESFAGMVHSLLGALAPIFAPVVWVIGLVAQMLDYVAANMNALLPMVLSMAGAIAFWNAQMIAGTVAGWASAAATWVQHASVSAYLVQLNLLTTAQRILNAVMNASPMMKALGVVMLLAGGFAMLIEKTGSVKNAWASVVNFFIDLQNLVASVLNMLFKKDIPIKAHMALDPVPEVEKTKAAVQSKQESAYGLAQPVTMPDTSALMAQLPDYSALSAGNSVCAGGVSGADWSGAPLAVDTVGILESVTGPVTMLDETMGLLRTIMAENRADVTVTPTVVVNATVREESDIRKLVSGIEQVLEEEFRASAEGVYSGTGGRTVRC